MASSSTKEVYKMGHSAATISSHESRTIHSDAAFLLPHLKPNSHLLDVGCGPGTITIGFADLVGPHGNVTGIDYTDVILQRARSLAASKGLSNVEFQQASVLERLPFEDATFDVVFASQLLVHLPFPDGPLTALREMRRVLKPGGVLASREGAVMSWYPFTAELDKLYTKNMCRGTGIPDFVGPRLREWLRLAGFDTEKAEIGGGATVYASKEGCRWWGANLVGRLQPGDKFRESWVKAGISEEEIAESAALLRKWAQHEDAWYGLMQSEVLVWK